jgi:hypothetical protein
MLCMTCGGLLSNILLPYLPGGNLGLSCFAYIVSAICMIIPIYCFDFFSVLCCFFLLECMVGVFNASGATLRAEYYPEALQSSIITLFRLPLNILVYYGTSLANNAGNNIQQLQNVFSVLVGLHTFSFLLLGYVHVCGTYRIQNKTKLE